MVSLNKERNSKDNIERILKNNLKNKISSEANLSSDKIASLNSSIINKNSLESKKS